MCIVENEGCSCSKEEFNHSDLCLSHFVAFEIWIANGGHIIYASDRPKGAKRNMFREALKLLSPDDTAEAIERKFAHLENEYTNAA